MRPSAPSQPLPGAAKHTVWTLGGAGSRRQCCPPSVVVSRTPPTTGVPPETTPPDTGPPATWPPATANPTAGLMKCTVRSSGHGSGSCRHFSPLSAVARMVDAPTTQPWLESTKSTERCRRGYPAGAGTPGGRRRGPAGRAGRGGRRAGGLAGRGRGGGGRVPGAGGRAGAAAGYQQGHGRSDRGENEHREGAVSVHAPYDAGRRMEVVAMGLMGGGCPEPGGTPGRRDGSLALGLRLVLVRVIDAQAPAPRPAAVAADGMDQRAQPFGIDLLEHLRRQARDVLLLLALPATRSSRPWPAGYAQDPVRLLTIAAHAPRVTPQPRRARRQRTSGPAAGDLGSW